MLICDCSCFNTFEIGSSAFYNATSISIHPIGDSHLLPELEGDHDTRSVPQPLTYDELGVICDDGDAVEIATGYFWARVIGRVAWLFAAALAGDFG